MKRRLFSALAALFFLAAPIATCAEPLHLDITSSVVAEQNNNNLGRVSTVGGTFFTNLGPNSVFATIGDSGVRRSASSQVGAARYHSPVYSLGFTVPANGVTSFSLIYGRTIDDGVVSRAQPKTIRSLTLSGTVHAF